MMKTAVKVTITNEDQGYSAHAIVDGNFIGTEAESLADLKNQIIDALNTSANITEYYKISDLEFEYDIQSFFDFFKIVNAKALSDRIGMHQSLLAQYIRGIKNPSQKQKDRIVQGIHEIGKELSEISILD